MLEIPYTIPSPNIPKDFSADLEECHTCIFDHQPLFLDTLSYDEVATFLISLRPQMNLSASQASTIPWQNLHTMSLVSQLAFPSAGEVICSSISARIASGILYKDYSFSRVVARMN
jgi:hypothetical protein